MNLIKSFNWSYLKENIKKSRGIIILLVLIVPLFTTLNTILNVNGTEECTNIPDKEWLATIDIYGMYIIPVLLSFLLFGYVYKKNSVDLVSSMPINRKSIFVTNTIIGVVLITIIQILTAIALLVCNHFLEYIHIYTGVIIDLFVVMWVSYLFVFTATNLAMTLSGTFSTQVLLTVIILMLVPFLVDSYNDFSNGKEYEIIVGNDSFTTVIQKDDEFSLPYKYLKWNDYYTYEYEYAYEIYNTTSIIKMLGLSIIYTAIGLYLFKRRRMENCEEAFSKASVHIFVKALTILPIIILLNMNEENRSIISNLCVIAFYYYIYDFIVRTKVGVKTSIVSFVLTIVMLYGICTGIDYLKDNSKMPKIKIEDVEEIAVSSDYYYNMYYFDILNIASGELFLKNDELIKTILNGGVKIEKQEKLHEEEFERYNNNEIDIMSTYVDSTRSVSAILKLNNGKKYKIDLYISEFDYDEMIKILENDETYLNLVRAELENDDKLMLNSKICSQEIQTKIKNEIKNKISSISKEQIQVNGSFGCVSKYYYENHKLVYKNLNIEMTPEMLNICANEINKETVEKLKKAVQNNESKSFLINLEYEPMWYGLSSSYFRLQRTRDEVTNVILQEQEFNPSKSFYMIQVNFEDGSYGNFFTNKVDEIDNLIQLEVEKNPEYYWQYEYDNEGIEKYYSSDSLFINYYYEENL